MTPFSGDPDLYIGKVAFPNTTVSTWKAVAYRGDSITISPDDPEFCACKYYVAVYSFSACTYVERHERCGRVDERWHDPACHDT